MYSKRTPKQTTLPKHNIGYQFLGFSIHRARLLDLYHSLVLTLSSDVSEYVTTPASGFALVASH